MKNAKKLLCFAMCVAIGAGIFNKMPGSATSISDFDEQIEALEQQKADNEQQIENLQQTLNEQANNINAQETYQATLIDKISLQEENLALTKDMINTLDGRIAALESDIAVLEDDIAAKEAEIDSDLEEFKLRLRAMYLTGDDSLASVLSGSTDFYDVLAKTELVSRLIQYDKELFDRLNSEIDALNDSKEELEKDKLLLENDRTSLEVTKTEYETALGDLESDYAQTDYVIDMLERQQEEYENQLANAQAQQEQYDAEIERVTLEKQEAIRAEEERKRREAAASGSQYTASYTYTGEAFLWPAGNFVYISSGYGARWGSTHRAIDIAGAGIHYQPAYAAADGMVITTYSGCTHDYGTFCSCGMTYGNYVTIDHGADSTGTSYATRYAHLASLAVSEGDIVKRGDVIGYIGSTGQSTGYHLHFEVIKNGTRVNPMDYFNRT